jgi:mono/diheme cytochrome c family protein
MRFFLVLFVLIAMVACNSYRPLPAVAEAGDWKTRVIPPSPQQTGGDPARGYNYLIAGDYIGSGIPYAFFRKKMTGVPDTVLRRPGVNADIEYGATAFQAPNGVRVVNGNCLTCHASEFQGEVVIGLGNSFSDYRKSLKPMATLLNLGMNLNYKKSDPEYRAFEDFGNYLREMAPHIETNQFGANPAFRLAEACMRHRDPEDLTYVKEPQYEMWSYNIATDVPPLWNVGKKNALYYNGIGRGDFTKLLFQASVLGIPDSTAARQAVIHFKDVLAWLESLTPPAYPRSVNADLVAQGEALFTEHCAGCHGTYGAEETYPNKIVHLDVIQTDSLYANYIANSGIVDWYNRSWFARSEPRSYFEPTRGYVAPPLDGVWATAPYLHNGSVPTIYNVLNSSSRPAQWTRSGDSRAYDFRHVGWQFDAKSSGDFTYDTTLPGYGNRGHYFGDKLSEPQRWAVIEYLKTL